MSGGGKQPADSLAALYRDSIRRHAAEPAGFRRPIAATHWHEEYNPLCGDRIEMRLRVAGDTVEEAAFDGEACAICMASASMLCGLAPGRTVAALRQLSDSLHEALAAPVGAAAAANNPESRLKPFLQQNIAAKIPAELEPLLGVRPYPSRIRCATLPWTAAVEALAGGLDGPGV